VTDCWDERQLLDVRYPEMQRLSQTLTHCDRTTMAAHALRGTKTPMGRPAAYFTHNDFSDRLKPLYLELIAAGEKNIITDSLAEGGLIITAEQLERNPLAIIDSESLQGSEVVQFVHDIR
jgi:hypothetical protein